MTTRKRRVKQLESELTPKQAFLLWLQEVQGFDNVLDYVRHLKTQPESAWPLVKLPKQVTDAIEKSMKGKPKDEIAKAVTQAVRDVLFLFKLWQEVNFKVVREEKYLWTRSTLMATELNALLREQSLQDQAMWNWVRASIELPYPLDAETAAAVEAAQKNAVLTWEVLEESGDLDNWVVEAFVAEGKTALPEGAYLLRDNARSIVTAVPTKEEVRILFEDSDSYEQFQAGDDFSYGLADVTDAEFEARYEALLKAVNDVAPTGTIVTLPTVPNAFLRETPLVDSEWIDWYVVALAEWGGRLIRKGYVLEESEDNHQMAWFRIVNPADGSEIDSAETDRLWQQTMRHLLKSPGRTREIEGRLTFNFNDYRKWRGRRAKWDLRAGASKGIAVSHWNQWIQADGDDSPTLLGVKVGKLNCHADRTQLHVCPGADELEEEIRRRETLLESLRVRQSGRRSEERFHDRVRSWKNLSETFPMELYTLRQVIDSINQRYFDGQEALFPGEAGRLSELLSHVEQLTDFYNEDLASRLESQIQLFSETEETEVRFGINLAELNGKINDPANAEVDYLVDMAKAEALSLMGETKKGLEFADRHIQPADTITK